MGQEITCVAHFGGKSALGKALLETTEILFRGELRLKIPFSSIKELKAADGELRVKTSKGLAVFELGAKAETWRDKVLNPKSLIEKLGVKAGDLVALHGPIDEDFRGLLKKRDAKIGVNANASRIFLAAEQRSELTIVKKLARDLQGAAACFVDRLSKGSSGHYGKRCALRGPEGRSDRRESGQL